MAIRRKPSALEWLVCGAGMLLGVGILGIYASGRLAGSTPENQLTRAEGVPSDVKLTQLSGRYGAKTSILTFTIAGYRTEYASDQPGYQAVFSAIKSAKPLCVWVSTRQETLFPRQGLSPLYKLSVGNEPVLTFAEVSAHHSKGARALPIIGSALLGLGSLCVFMCFHIQRQHSAGVNK
jgi:hypothetical protein